MIDLVLQGTLANLQTLLLARGLIDADNNPKSGFDYCLWAGSGKFMTAKPTYDLNGTLLTPAAYMTDLVLIARISDESDTTAEGSEQWQRSRVAKWIKSNGVAGTIGGLPCYTIKNVRLLRAVDVFDWCATRQIPSHEWAGGNVI